MNGTQKRLGHFCLPVLLISTGLLAQQTEAAVLDIALVEAHVRAVVEAASDLQVDEVGCPEAIPQRQGEITLCKVLTSSGEMQVFIEQTDSEGGVFGTLDNPNAGEVLKSFQDAFMQRLSGENSNKFYDDWLTAGMKSSVSRITIDGIFACRRATMKQIATTQRIGANISADATKGYLVLRFESEALPVSARLNLVPENGVWRLDGMLFPPPLPKTLPSPEQVRERFYSFIQSFDESDWDLALQRLSPEFAAATPRLRPAVELALKRSLLGRSVDVGSINLRLNDFGGLSAEAPVELEHTAATIVLSYMLCGENLELNGYTIIAQPDSPIKINSDQMARTLELQLWRDDFGEVSVSCPAFETVQAGKNVSVECQAQRADETVRAVVTFKSIGGDYDMKMEALE